MAIVEVKVPQLSESVAEATMLQWKKKVGDIVAADEILIEIETDKVVLEVPAPSAGVLSEILIGDGATVPGRRYPQAFGPPQLLHLLQSLRPLWLFPQRLRHRPAWPAWPCQPQPS